MRGNPIALAIIVVRIIARNILLGLIHPWAQARLGPNRVSLSLPRLKSK